MYSAEEARINGNIDRKDAEGQGTSRIHSLSDLITRSEGDEGDLSPESRRAEREGSDFDDDMEMEMEIEVLVGGREIEDEREREMGSRQGSSLNLRLRRRVNNNRERSTKSMNYIHEMQQLQNNNNQPLLKVTKSLYIVTDLGQLPFTLFTQIA